VDDERRMTGGGESESEIGFGRGKTYIGVYLKKDLYRMHEGCTKDERRKYEG